MAGAPPPAPGEPAPGDGAAAAPPPPPPPDEVTILGNRASRVTGSAHVLRREQLDRFRQDDPHQVLLAVPGVYVRGEDGFGLRPNIGLRGATSDRSKKVTLMEDGVLFGPAPYAAPAAYYFPVMARMRAVRVLKGPSSIVYGPQTVGGAVDLLTRDIPATRKGMVDVALGQYGYRKLHAVYGASDVNYGFLLEGIQLASTGFKKIDGDPDADTGYVRNEWMGKGLYRLDLGGQAQHELGVKLGYSDEVSHETYLGLSDEDFRASPYRRYTSSRDDRMKWHRTQIEATHRAVFPGGFEAETTVYHHYLHRIWDRVKEFSGSTSINETLASPNFGSNRHLYGVLTGRESSVPAGGQASADDRVQFGPNDREFVSEGIQTTLKLRGRTGPIEHRLEYGARLHHDSIRRLQSEDAKPMVDGRLQPSGAAITVNDDNMASATALALHLFDQIGYRRLMVAPGVRVEMIQTRYDDHRTGKQIRNAYQVVSPGIGGFFGITRDFGLLAGVHRGFSPAPPETSKATPEDSTNYEAGARYDNRLVRAEVIGFFNNYRNLTDICTFSNGCAADQLDQQVSAGGAHIYGVEVFAESRLKVAPATFVPVRGTYTLTRTKFLRSFTAADTLFGNVVAGDEMPYVPRHQASGSVGFERAWWGLNVGGTYVGEMREQAGGSPDRQLLDDGPRTDAYFLLDASGSIKPTERVTVYVNGRNLLDEAYLVARRPIGARPGAPRWIQAGVQLTFD